MVDEGARMSENKQTRIQIRNRQNILKHATAAFAQNGFKGATVEDIASRADMSQPNLHHYFKTKFDLYHAVLSDTLDTWLDLIGGLKIDGDPATEISAYIERKIEMSRLYPEASRVFAQEMLSGAPVLKPLLETQVRQKADEFARIISAWIDAGRVRKVDPYHLLFTIWSATQHYADFAPQVSAVLGKRRLVRKDFDAARRALTSLILHGLIVEPS
jgi:TetR/AcrR family transcriptional regulator